MTEKEIDVVVAGHLCLDMFPEFMETEKMSLEELFIPGKLINIGGMAISTGGLVSNTGIAMQILGVRVTLIASIGADFIGNTILNCLKSRVSVEGIKIISGESSSYTIVLAPQDVDRIFLHNPGANDSFCFDDINFDLVKKAKLFHLGYPPLMKRLYENDGEELRRIYEKVNELGVITSLDFSLPDPNSQSGKTDWKVVLKKVLPYIDIFIPSVEEAQFILDREKFLKLRKRAKGKDLLHFFDVEELTRLSNRFLRYGSKIIGLKCGHKGFYVKTAGQEKLQKINGVNPENWAVRELWAPSYHIDKFASAAGAGDAAIAGFLVALLRGESIEMCLKYACVCGAQNVQALDAISGIRNWKETTSKVKKRWKQNELKINSTGWIYDHSENLWHGSEDQQ